MRPLQPSFFCQSLFSDSDIVHEHCEQVAHEEEPLSMTAFRPRTPRTHWEWLFLASAIAGVAVPVMALVYLLGDIALDSSGRLSLAFITSYPSRKANEAKISLP